MNEILKWGQFVFTGLAGCAAAISPVVEHPSPMAWVAVAGACCVIWAGLCAHPPWTVSAIQTPPAA